MSDSAGLVVTRGANDRTCEPDPLKGGDVYGWAMDQAELIRAGRYADIDWVNVADEIESVGKSEVRALTSNLEILLAHMLKWDHQPGRRSRSWVGSIDKHRARIDKDLSDSPSLKSKLGDAIADGYRFARYVAARETGLDRGVFPAECPYDLNTIMTRPFVLDDADGGAASR